MTNLNSENARAALAQADAMTLAARQRAVWPRWAAIIEAVVLFFQQLGVLYGLILLQSPEANYNGAIGVLSVLGAMVLTVVFGMFEPFMFRRMGVKPAVSRPFSWSAWRPALIFALLMFIVLIAAEGFGWLWAPLPLVAIVVIRIYRRRRRGLGRY